MLKKQLKNKVISYTQSARGVWTEDLRLFAVRLIGVLLLAGCGSSGADRPGPAASPRAAGGAVGRTEQRSHQAVLELNPVGYWPADQGEGKTLRDLSDTQNDGVIRHVPWSQERNLLNFTGAYQWLEIPKNEAYQTPAFSMGGWVFLRSKVIGSGWVNRQGMLLLGNRHWLNQVGVQLCIRKQEVIDVVSDGTEDVLGTRRYASYKDGKRVEQAYGKPNLAIGRWHHLLYTFEPDKHLGAPPASANLAPTATVSASNDGGHRTRAPKNAVDNNPATGWIVWPGASPQPDTKMWIQLDFDEEIGINRIRLVSRPGKTDWFKAGKLHFSDGSSIDVPALTDEWDAMFATKQVRWVRFEASENHGPRPGLAEFELYREDVTVYQEEGVVMRRRRGEGVAGTGRLYLNGQLIASNDNIHYNPANANLQIGNDAYWWHQQAGKSGSLDGSVRGMVWFDRVLSPHSVERLFNATRPEMDPEVFDEHALVIDDVDYREASVNGREVTLQDWPHLGVEDRREALETLESRKAEQLQDMSGELLPVLKQALDDWRTRRAAAGILVQLTGTEAAGILRNRAVPLSVRTIRNADRSREARAETALALAEMGDLAEDAVPALAETLEEIIEQADARIPRVEDLLRNALIRALLDIRPQAPETRRVVGRAFAKPILNALDLKSPRLDKDARAGAFRELVKTERYMDALELYAKLHHTARDRFFTHKAAKDRDYTATARFDGATYKVGEGVAWKGVENVPVDDYKAVVAELAEDHPDAVNWRQPDYEHLYRVPITKVTADGKERKVYLEGNDFILDGRDAKCRAWSIFVDELGYIHVMGGQHNAPNPDLYIPGSWEEMGVSRNRKSEDYPLQMYWVSTEPESIDSFKFAGQRNNPQAIPAGYLNYLVFVQSPSNETFLYGRAGAFGWQCWGMFRYDAAVKRWKPVGGDPYAMIQSASRDHPDWFDYLHDPVRGSVPDAPGDIRRLVWAWQPPFYNFCRDNWGAKFDNTGRLHVHMQISGLDERGYNRLTSVYAWSDDRGETFHRADGSPVKLPLTVNPAPEHNADIRAHASRQWWTLWISLLRHAGYNPRKPSRL